MKAARSRAVRFDRLTIGRRRTVQWRVVMNHVLPDYASIIVIGRNFGGDDSIDVVSMHAVIPVFYQDVCVW